MEVSNNTKYISCIILSMHPSPLSNGDFYQAGQPQMLFCLPLMTGTKILTMVPSMCLQKAFDSVPHHFLIAKLRQLNINKFVKWIVDYLTDKTQCIGVEGTSLPQPVLSGVPQGSVLGTLLFIIYIDGLTDALSNSSMRLYADDLLLYRTI